MILRMATEKDLELLTELRMAYILDGGRMLPEEEKRKFAQAFGAILRGIF